MILRIILAMVVLVTIIGGGYLYTGGGQPTPVRQTSPSVQPNRVVVQPPIAQPRASEPSQREAIEGLKLRN